MQNTVTYYRYNNKDELKIISNFINSPQEITTI